MEPDRFERLKEILLTAADLSEAEREIYLGKACKDDPELRKEAESILAHGTDPSGILKTGGGRAGDPESAPATTRTALSPLPRQIAGYRILRKLGEGGMGVVYEAEQPSPRRPVAVKVVRGGAYVDEHRVKLFQREAQTLGRLKHPSIAGIYEAGRTEDGQHFFAMELVRGTPLDEHLKSHPIRPAFGKADIRARLALFLQVCDAINYAHQRGIIHRDLKPSNILVLSGRSSSRSGPSGEQTRVKVLDFGLARMTDTDVSMTTLATETGRIQGTLAYMSPEQARGNPDEIDLRSDVYSLGVILYELLTDRPPYDVHQTLIHEAVRMICEEEPVRPSSIERTLRGDLETIALKALEKEPHRRYQSVSALAEDIDRYLADQPVLARPPSMTYQLRKLFARHRGGAIFSGSVIVLLMVLGVILAAFGFMAVLVVILVAFGITMSVMFGAQRAEKLRADRERDRAVREAEVAARVTFTLEEMLASVDPARSGRDVTVREMLDATAKTLYEKFKDQPPVEARLRHTVGKTYYELGESDAAEEHLQRAVEIRRQQPGAGDPTTLAAMHDLAWAYMSQGRLAEAELLAKETVENSSKALGSEDPQTLLAMLCLGVSYKAQGRLDEAHPLYRDVLTISRRALGNEHRVTLSAMECLGEWCYREGRYHEAEALMREALEIRRRVLGEEHPLTLRIMQNLANPCHRQGRLEEAVALNRQALRIARRVMGEAHPGTLATMGNLATRYVELGRYAEAEQIQRERMEITRRSLGEEHPNTLTSVQSLAYCYSKQGRHDEAEALLRETLDLSRRAHGENHAATNELRYGLACGFTLQGRPGEAVSILREALDHGYRGPRNRSSISDDPDLASLQSDPAFREIVAELGRRPIRWEAPL